MLARLVCLFMVFFSCNSVFASTTKPVTKTVLVTGGVSGIGREIALAFQKDGWDVWATSRTPDKYETLEGITVRKLDVTDQTNIKQLIKEITTKTGRLDVLVNNAGFAVIGPTEAISVTEARDIMDVNVIGPLLIIQESLPAMRANHGGHIINISSTSGLRALPGLGIYAASKMALEGLSEALAAEVAQWNINIAIIEPGSVNNNWANNSPIAENINSYPGYKSFTTRLQKTLSKRATEIGQNPQEIAQLAVKIANTPKPNLRYQTSTTTSALANEILIDPTGNKMRDKTVAFGQEMFNSKL